MPEDTKTSEPAYLSYHQHACVAAKPCTWEDAMHCPLALTYWFDALRRLAVIHQRINISATVNGRLPQEILDMVMRWAMTDNLNIPNVEVLLENGTVWAGFYNTDRERARWNALFTQSSL